MVNATPDRKNDITDDERRINAQIEDLRRDGVDRVVRIAISAGILFVVYWLGNYAIEILDKPFATLSPLKLLIGLGAGALTLALIGAAFFVAFDGGMSLLLRKGFSLRHGGSSAMATTITRRSMVGAFWEHEPGADFEPPPLLRIDGPYAR